MGKHVLFARISTAVMTMFFVVLILSSCSRLQNSTNNTNQILERIIDLPATCSGLNGTWIEDSKECEGITAQDCTELNGVFDDCASACRNDPIAQACTLQCVPVCKFNK